MKKFTIEILEIHVSYREVEAETLAQAVELGNDCAYETYMEYSHTPDAPIGIFYTETGERITDDFHRMPQTERFKAR